MIDVSALPKAEFHLHFEATLGWREFAAWAARPEYDGFDHAPWLDAADPFPTFEEFLAPWRRHIGPALARPGAYEAWAQLVAAWLASRGVRYAELGVGLNFLEKIGHDPETTVPALCRAMDEAEKAHGVALRLVGALKRDAPPAENARAVERWRRLAGPRLSGIDLHGWELEGPTAAQRPAFDLARSMGLALRAHAGEHGTWRDVRDAVEVLGVSSVNHGVRAIDDGGLVRELAARGVALHVCPTSNVMLHVSRSYAEHPVRRLLAAGVTVTVNSDDPLLFGTDVNREFDALQRLGGLSEEEVKRLLGNAWACARIDDGDRRGRLAAIG